MKYICIIILVVFVGRREVVGEVLSPEKILKKTQQVMYHDSAKFISEMTIIRKDRQKNAEVEIWLRGRDRFLVKIISPSSDRGIAFLHERDNLWVYLPEIERSFRVTERYLILGGDFSYFDIVQVDLVKEYTAELIEETEQYYLLILRAKGKEVIYPIVKCWISKENFFYLKQEFYTSAEKLLKRLTFSEVKYLGNKLMPTKLTMENALRQGYKTILKHKQANFEIAIPDHFFSRSMLDIRMK